MKRTFVMLPIFDERWAEAGLRDVQLASLQSHLLDDPKAGDVVKDMLGLRKIRWRLPGRGKSGSIRVFYLDVEAAETIYLLTVLKKSVRADLAPIERRIIRKLITMLKNTHRRLDDG